MTRKSISNVFALTGAALVVCGFVFSHNGGIVTVAIFGGWVCLIGGFGFRHKKEDQGGDYTPPISAFDPSRPGNLVGDHNYD